MMAKIFMKLVNITEQRNATNFDYSLDIKYDSEVGDTAGC